MKRNAGKRRHLARILKDPSLEQDSVGQPVLESTVMATRWAQVEPLNGREYFSGQQNIAAVSTRITMDYVHGIDPTMRVHVEGVIYNIIEPIDVELRHITHVLMCSSGVIPNG